MGSGEDLGAGDSEEDPLVTRFRNRFILNPRECVLVEVAGKGVQQVASLSVEGVETAVALAANGLARTTPGREARRPDAPTGI